MANIARVTQSFVELAAQQNGTARVTQSFVEFAVGVGIQCGNPPSGRVGVLYTTTFPSGGGVLPIVFSLAAGAFPPGLTLNAGTGVLSGVPTSVGVFNFTVQVTDSSGGSAAAACSITILGGVLITLYGWKLYPESPCAETEQVGEAPKVKRAV